MSASAAKGLPDIVEMTAQFHAATRHGAVAIARRVHEEHPKAQVAIRRARSPRPKTWWTVHARLPRVKISLEGIQAVGDHFAEVADEGGAELEWQALRAKKSPRRSDG